MPITHLTNVLPEYMLGKMKAEMLGTWFPWYFFGSSAHEESVKEQGDGAYTPTSVFRHRFYDSYKVCSNWHKIVDDVVAQMTLQIRRPVVVKAAYANLLQSTSNAEGSYDVPHVDRTEQDDNAMTAVLFFNTTNSKTCFYQEEHCEEEENFNGVASKKQLTPEQYVDTQENELVYFKCRKYHSAPSWTDQPRLVLNINFNLG